MAKKKQFKLTYTLSIRLVAGLTAKGRTAYHRQKIPGLRSNITMAEICRLIEKLQRVTPYPIADIKLIPEIEELVWNPKKDNAAPGLLMRAFLLANVAQEFF